MANYTVQYVYEVQVEAKNKKEAGKLAWEDVRENPPQITDLAESDIREEGEI